MCILCQFKMVNNSIHNDKMLSLTPEFNQECFDKYEKKFGEKTYKRCGKQYRWLEYCSRAVYNPDGKEIYEYASENSDYKLDGGSPHNSNFSYFALMCNFNGFNQIKYMLDRIKVLSGKPYKNSAITQQTFCFYTNQPAYVYGDLVKNPGAVKTGKTNWFCITSMQFSFTPSNFKIYAYMRKSLASHLCGDIVGVYKLGMDLEKCTGYKFDGFTFFIPSYTNDLKSGWFGV